MNVEDLIRKAQAPTWNILSPWAPPTPPAQPAAPVNLPPQPTYPHMPVLFLLLDVIPDYIQKTFGLNSEGRFAGSSMLRTVKEGQDIPDNLEFGVIIFNDSQYHMEAADRLFAQIERLFPRARVMMLPVKG